MSMTNGYGAGTGGGYRQPPQQQQEPQTPAPGAPPFDFDKPIIQVAPMMLSLAHIKWIGALIISGIFTAQGAGWLFMPAKQTELTALVGVVRAIDERQMASQKAVERLTVAVDNLSAIVSEMGQAPDTEKPAQPRRRSNKAKPAAL